MCDCKKQITEKMKKALGVDDGFLQCEVLPSRTYSTFYHGKRDKGGNLTSETNILHSFCPFCGEKYEEVEK